MSNTLPATRPGLVRRLISRVRAWIGGGAYEGATKGRRDSWSRVGTAQDPSALIARDVRTLRARSHHAVRNTWVGARAMSVLTAKIVGSGITPSAPGKLGAMVTEWAKPQVQVGAEKGQSWLAIQNLVMRTVCESGMAIVVQQPRSAKEMRRRGLVVPWDLRVYSPEWLDTSRDDGGIEIDDTGWPVAYYLRDPAAPYGHDAVRIPAERVSVPLDRLYPGQTIGLPWLTPVLLKQHDYDQFEDAELMRAKTAAMFVGFVRSPALGGVGAGDLEPLSLEPGRLQELAPGEDVTFTAPPEMTSYAEYSRSSIRAIAAGLGLSYEDLSGDYSQVNFSSARMGALVGNRLIDTWRMEILISILCSDVERWLRDSASLQRIRDADITWTMPGHSMIDPGREIAAKTAAIDAGLTSRRAEIRRSGRDPDEVLAEREQDAADDAALAARHTTDTVADTAAVGDEQ